MISELGRAESSFLRVDRFVSCDRRSSSRVVVTGPLRGGTACFVRTRSMPTPPTGGFAGRAPQLNGAASFEFKFGLPVSEPVLLAASLAGPGPRALRQAWADSQVWPESRPAGCRGAAARRRHGAALAPDRVAEGRAGHQNFCRSEAGPGGWPSGRACGRRGRRPRLGWSAGRAASAADVFEPGVGWGP